jgi:hypothetical protein
MPEVDEEPAFANGPAQAKPERIGANLALPFI